MSKNFNRSLHQQLAAAKRFYAERCLHQLTDKTRLHEPQDHTAERIQRIMTVVGQDLRKEIPAAKRQTGVRIQIVVDRGEAWVSQGGIRAAISLERLVTIRALDASVADIHNEATAKVIAKEFAQAVLAKEIKIPGFIRPSSIDGGMSLYYKAPRLLGG